MAAKGAGVFLDFMAAAFGADLSLRVENPDGTIGHAEARIGDAVIMTFDSAPDWPETPALLSLYIDDIEVVLDRAVAAGATVITELRSSGITGDRGARLRDPVGNIWWVQTHLRDVPTDEMYAAFSDPGELATMQYAQETFAAEMRSRSATR